MHHAWRDIPSRYTFEGTYMNIQLYTCVLYVVVIYYKNININLIYLYLVFSIYFFLHTCRSVYLKKIAVYQFHILPLVVTSCSLFGS